MSKLFSSLYENKESYGSNNKHLDIVLAGNFVSYQGLPVSSVISYNAPNSKMTAVFIPQNHRYPGSDINDAKNNSAETAQNQIYAIIDFLYKQFNINFVMVEGEMYGTVDSVKIDSLAEKINDRDKFAAAVDSFKNLISKTSYMNVAGAFLKSADAYVTSLDREIILQGASYKVKAENSDVIVYGSENPNTYKECALIVQNYISQQARLQELNNAPANNYLSYAGTYGLLSLLKQTQNNIDNTFVSLERNLIVSGDEKLIKAFSDIKIVYGDIQTKERGASVVNSAQINNSNPYASINQISELEQIMSATEEKIQKMVIDQRNAETAENFVKGLQSENATIGILQFGAGHEEGLIKELNNRGISVIVVKPIEVEKSSL